jgi:putative flippase GtrA
MEAAPQARGSLHHFPRGGRLRPRHAAGGTALLYGQLHIALWLAAALAIQAAIVVNFTFNSLITWRDRTETRSRLHRLLSYEGVSLVGSGINEGALLTAVGAASFHHLFAVLCGAAAASTWNHVANGRATPLHRSLFLASISVRYCNSLLQLSQRRHGRRPSLRCAGPAPLEPPASGTPLATVRRAWPCRCPLPFLNSASAALLGRPLR